MFEKIRDNYQCFAEKIVLDICKCTDQVEQITQEAITNSFDDNCGQELRNDDYKDEEECYPRQLRKEQGSKVPASCRP